MTVPETSDPTPVNPSPTAAPPPPGIPSVIPSTVGTSAQPFKTGDPTRVANIVLIASIVSTLITLGNVGGSLTAFGAADYSDDSAAVAFIALILGVVGFAGWLVSLIGGHLGVARSLVYFGTNRTKMIIALVLAYVQLAITIIAGVLYLLVIVAFFGFLAILFGM